MDEVQRDLAKSRALRKYEAPPFVVDVDPIEPRLDLYSPFGPLIAKAEMRPDFVERLNSRADPLARPNESSEFRLSSDIVFEGGDQSLMSVTEGLIRRYVTRIDGVAPQRVRIDIFWIVSQQASSPSPVHFHSSDISGVLYLKTPKIDGEEDEERKTYISGRQAGYINFLIGGKQKHCKSLASFKPRVGDFYIFPGWLLHGAEPFRGTGERRSLAFNAYLDGSAD